MLAVSMIKVSAIAIALAVPAAPLLAQNATLDNLVASQAFPAWQTTVKYDLPTTGPNAGKPANFGNYTKVTASIRYDKPSNSYIVRDTGSATKTSTFGPGQITSSNATFTTYAKTTGTTTETLRLLKPGGGNPLIALTYASYGQWRTNTPGASWTGAPIQSDTYFVYGIKTTGAQMPRTGSANYNTKLDGTFVNKTALYAVSGDGTLNADFFNAKLTFSATPLGTPASGPVLAFGAINGTGSISTSNASFAGAGSNATYKMDMSGYFFGPTANEIGAVFRLSGGGGNGNGAMVGKQ